LVVAQEDGGTQEAIAWRWGEYCPLPKRIDVAYKLKENHYNGNTTIDLEVVGIRLPAGADGGTHGALDRSEGSVVPAAGKMLPKTSPSGTQSGRSIAFEYEQRRYTCAVYEIGSKTELRVRNDRGQVLVVEKGQRTGLLGTQRDRAQVVDVSRPHFYKLIKAAVQALDRSQALE
jgi:single-stranded-DNA-specific exonuclease